MAIAYTDPKLDFDVSDVLERVGVMEGGITQVRGWLAPCSGNPGNTVCACPSCRINAVNGGPGIRGRGAGRRSQICYEVLRNSCTRPDGSHPLLPTPSHLIPSPPPSHGQIFYEVLRKGCIRPDGSRALVLDVGANFGYFSVYAALLGCRYAQSGVQ